MTFDEGKEEITKLCQYFATNQQAFLSEEVKEAHVRQLLIDPFFEALGWDVRNTLKAAPQYREVVIEDSLEVEGHQKSTDYAFRIGTSPNFYAEAKKCRVNINTDPAPACQLRRYGWSAKVALSILTDFQELAVYDCTFRPRPSDKASHARIHYLRFDEYPGRWREIWDIFSHEAVWSGAFDDYAASKRKRGASEVDEEFLKDIEGWREVLARNMALRNMGLSSDDLNAAVQCTIDRVVFLRMAEDRGLEPYEKLLRLCEGAEVYARFIDLCRKADEKYNSGLFHFRKESGVSEAPDQVTPTLTVDDKVLKPILQSLYFAYGSPYHFGVLPVEILGSVYERFLGKVIRLTAGHQAKVEEKSEVRKAGGVYYTPSYIVDYIVKQTVLRQIEGRSPAQLANEKNKRPFRILDMACGSGSFLLGAYQCLLDHCLKWYIDHKDGVKKKAVYKDAQGGWRLTIEEKKRILTTHIFGVDIDAQAVEVSKLSLLLKALEGENDATFSTQLKLNLFHERALPNLEGNIRCGNSLIGPGYFMDKLIGDADEVKQVRPFDWNQGFPEAMKAGGFDAVIGNPPWISLSGKFKNEVYSEKVIEFLMNRYGGNRYMPNMYEYFVAQGLTLTRNQGYFSFIVPDRLGFNSQFVQLRKRILNETSMISLVYKTPFPRVTADTLIFVFRKCKADAKHEVRISEYGKAEIQMCQTEIAARAGQTFDYFEDSENMRLVAKIESSAMTRSLESLCESTSGFGGKSELIVESRSGKEQIPTFKGDSIGRYEMRKTYWFDFRKENITGRTTDKGKLGASPKILLRKTGDRIIATYDESGVFPEQSLYFLFNKHGDIDYKYLLGIINSRLLTFYYRARSLTNKKSIAQVKKVDLDRLPIRKIELSDPTDKARHDRIVELVGSMLVLRNEIATTKSVAQRDVIQQQFDATDKEVDRLVYDLYGLTAKEIAIVEGK